MGGSVAVTIRKENSEIIKMARRTGSCTALLFSEEFNYGDKDKAINDFIAIFSGMREDYLKGKPYQYEMTPEYGWCDMMIPYGYGLIVLDFQNKKIHSLQGYDTPGFMSIVSMRNNVYEDPEEEALFSKMMADPDFFFYTAKGECMGSAQEFFGSDISLTKLETLFDTINRNDKAKDFDNEKMLNINFGKFKAKALHDFEIVKYKESIEDFLQLAQNLKNDGFEFTEQEKAEWIDYAASNFLEDLEPEDDIQESYQNMSEEEYQKNLDILKKSYIEQLESILNSTTQFKIKNKI